MFTLSMFSLLGMFVMISGSNFLLIYLGLELLTLSSYALVALRRDNAVASEAAMKYFVLGAMASGFLLYGLSMMYGATGSLDINEVFKAIASRKVNHQVLVFGLVFIVAGLAFKLGAAPFHMWVPDVYQGAPTAVTLMIGAAPELAAFAIIIRLLVEGLLPLAIDWQQMLALLAIASLLVGNLAAIAQTNLKRMLAYSTISQMGFMLLGLVAGVVNDNTYNAQFAYSASMFYIVTYVLTTLASFGIILLLAREGFESEEITDLAGLNQRSPLYAGVMAIAMFSLAGIPPLVGFYAKLAVLQALIASGQGLYIALAVFAVVMSLIGAFYYMRVVKVMYFDAPVTATHGVGAARRARRADAQRRADPDPRHRAGRPHDALRAGDRGHAGQLTRQGVSQGASVWVVLLVALAAANLPFSTSGCSGWCRCPRAPSRWACDWPNSCFSISWPAVSACCSNAAPARSRRRDGSSMPSRARSSSCWPSPASPGATCSSIESELTWTTHI